MAYGRICVDMPALHPAPAPSPLVMFKRKLNWRRPLFYLLLPVFFVMVFLGFPIPVPPPPATKSQQEESAPVRPEQKR